MALSRVNAPLLAENCTNPFSRWLASEEQPKMADGGKLLLIGSVEGRVALLPKGVLLPSVPERLQWSQRDAVSLRRCGAQ
jgi:hypothetical protein